MFREQQKRVGVHADIVTSLRPLTSYTRSPVRPQGMAPILYFFINRRTKLPTIGGWCLAAVAIFCVVHCVLLLRTQSGINPKFQPFLPMAPQEEEFRWIAENNQRGDDLPVIPLFDQNKHVKAVGAIDSEKMKKVLQNRPQPKSFPVTFLRTPNSGCDSDVSLLLVVLSRAEHHVTRHFIRETWGKYQDDKFGEPLKIKWSHIFVFGRTDNSTEEVNKEYDSHGDVLQGDFEDSPYENTRKFLMAVTWVTKNLKHCKIRFVLKTEDNIFHNMAAISGWIQAKFTTHMIVDKHLYIGKLIRKDRPIRDENNPLYVSEVDYPNSFFPDFIMGPVYLFSYHSFSALYELINNVTPIAMEDSYVGLLTHSSGDGIIPQHNDHFQMLSKPVETCHYLRMFFIYNVLPSEHLAIYKKMEEHRLNKQCLDARQEIENKLTAEMIERQEV